MLLRQIYEQKLIEAQLSDITIGFEIECIIDGNKKPTFIELAKKYKRKLGSGYQYCIEQLSNDDINWLMDLPEELSVNFGQKSIFMSHGNLTSIDSYLYPDEKREVILANYSESMITIYGHSHYPFIHSNDNKFIINPGSVGQARDYKSKACWAIWNISENKILFKRTKYDTSSVLKQCKKYDPKLKYLNEVIKKK